MGHRVTVAALPGPVDIRAPGVAMYPLPVNPIAAWRKLERLMADDEPQVCHVSALSIPQHTLWIPSVRRNGIRLVVSPHGLLSPAGLAVRWEGKRQTRARGWLKSAYHRTFDIPLLGQVDCVHAQSDFERECILRINSAARVAVIPLGIDAEWIGPDASIRRQLGIPVTFGYLGRLDVYHKGLDLILDAVSHLATSRPVRIVFAGSSIERFRRQLEGRAGKLGVEIRGETWGADKERFWRDCSYFLGVFRFAGMARAVGEALARGVPVIASREGNWGDTVARHGMGFAVALEAPSIASCMTRAADLEEAQYRSLSAAALKFARQWTWARVAESTIAMYANAA